MGEKRPYLESSNSELNVQNYKKFIDAQRFSVIEVFANKCAGCRQVEPLLPQIQKQLGVPIGKMDLLNEAAFLADVQTTPTFLVYDKKKGKFFEVDLHDSDSDGELADILCERIGAKLKELS